MGSPLRLCRFALLLATAAVLSAVSATSAVASPEDDARAAAVAFADAVTSGDLARMCALFSPDALARLGGMARCQEDDRESEDVDDYAAMETLSQAHVAARLSATKRNGRYVTKKFGARKLARDMEQLDGELTVKLGKGSAAAKGQLDTTVILDTRSTARRLVLYAESDDGSIFRLTATGTGRPQYEEVGFGIPESTRPQSEEQTLRARVTIDSVSVDGNGAAYARGTWVVSDEDDTYTISIVLLLVPVNGTYLVDDILYSTILYSTIRSGP